LLARKGHPKDGLDLLRPVYEQFTEGLETGDLKSAQRLLASLASIDS
jgi:predicted ATPase